MLQEACELTDGALVPDDTVRNAAVGTNAGVAADENVLLHLAAVSQADSGAPVHVVTRVSAATPLLVREVRLGREGIEPTAHKVRRHRVVHQQVGYTDTVAIFSDMDVDLIAEDLQRQ